MMIEPDDEAEVEADALIELVDAPPTGRATPPPPPASKLPHPYDSGITRLVPEAAPAAEASHSPSSPPSPPFSSHPPSRLSSLPLAPPRPGTPSSNPIPGDRPSSPPRASTFPRAPSSPSHPSLLSSPAAVSSPAVVSSPALPSPVVLPPKDDAAAELRDQLEWSRRALSVKETEMRAVLGQRDTSIAELEAVRRRLIMREHAAKEFENTLAARDARIRELEQELEAARSSAGGATDDLKRIKGIGPAFERELRRLGITTFAQIAAWTAEELESISKKIKAKPERVRRDNWVGRASELAAERGQP